MRTSQRYRDPAKNAFAKSNLFYTSSPFIGIQDPTVFGFKLFFEFDNVSSPLLYGLNGDASQAPKNTALGFLKSINDEQRIYYLQKFIYLLSGINSQTPWYFQSLAGLKDAWKHDYTKPYIGDDKKLEIECYESIDLRLTALMDLYRKACYDWKNRRMVIPENLRQFKLSVYVYEARVFGNPNAISFSPPEKTPEYGYGGNIQGEASRKNAELVSRLIGRDETRNDPSTNVVNTMEGVQMSTTRNLFHFHFCEFNFDEPMHLETIMNTEPTEVKQKMAIMYKDVEEENMYNFWMSQDPVTDSYVATLDQLALDDPSIQEPGTPQETGLTTSTQTETNQGPKGDINDLIQEADKRKNRLAEEARNAVLGTQEVAQNIIDRAKGAVNKGQLGTETGNTLAERAIRAAARAAQSELNGLFFGNVYGFSPSTLTGAAGAESLASLVQDAGTSILNSSGTPPTGTPSQINQNTNYGPSLQNDRRDSGYQGEKDTGAF